MIILQSTTFKKSIKKFHQNQVSQLKKIIGEIQCNPYLGDLKKGDLAGIRVHKFRIHHQLLLLAYFYKEEEPSIILLDVSSHENFYKDLRNQINI